MPTRERTEAEEKQIATFVAPYFGENYQPAEIGQDENRIVEAIVTYVEGRFNAMKYILGLALDFTLLAQRLSQTDGTATEFRPELTKETLFENYPLVEERGGKLSNTLSVRYNGASYGIRKIEEAVVELFHLLGRSGYPSAYVYNTGQWQKYPELLVNCFQLSEAGRFIACQRLIDFGLQKLTENRFFGRETARVRLFPLIIESYDRAARKTENGGVVFQGIVFGYLTADSPNLNLIADKVRTGSARQKRFGDVDCYFGLDLELSAEVKDLPITATNVEAQLGNFATQVAGNNINGIAFAVSFTQEAVDELRKATVKPFSQAAMLSSVELWDWQKQDRAVQGLLHYLSHIEQNPDATNRLLSFIGEHDSGHSSLTYFTQNQVEASELKLE